MFIRSFLFRVGDDPTVYIQGRVVHLMGEEYWEGVPYQAAVDRATVLTIRMYRASDCTGHISEDERTAAPRHTIRSTGRNNGATR